MSDKSLPVLSSKTCTEIEYISLCVDAKKNKKTTRAVRCPLLPPPRLGTSRWIGLTHLEILILCVCVSGAHYMPNTTN
jgi:hypothetical protein